MSLYFALETVENNENMKSVKFQEDLLIFVILFRLLYIPQITTLTTLSTEVQSCRADVRMLMECCVQYFTLIRSLPQAGFEPGPPF